MTRRHPLLSLFALAWLAPLAVAATASSSAPGLARTIEPKPADATCNVATAAVGPVSDRLSLAATTPGFILCTCKLCLAHPAEICQVSPSGFSIHCSDWARQNCPSATAAATSLAPQPSAPGR